MGALVVAVVAVVLFGVGAVPFRPALAIGGLPCLAVAAQGVLRFRLWSYLPFQLLGTGLAIAALALIPQWGNPVRIIVGNLGALVMGIGVVALLVAGAREHRDQAKGLRSRTEVAVVTLSVAAWYITAMAMSWRAEPDWFQRLSLYVISPMMAALLLIPALILLSRLKYVLGPVLVLLGLVATSVMVVWIAVKDVHDSLVPTGHMQLSILGILLVVVLITWGLTDPSVVTLADGSASWRVDRAWQRTTLLIGFPALAVGTEAFEAATWQWVLAPVLLMVAIGLLGLRARLTSEGLLARRDPRPGDGDPQERLLTLEELTDWCRAVEPINDDIFDAAAIVVLPTVGLDGRVDHGDDVDEQVARQTAQRLLEVTWARNRLDSVNARWEICRDRDRFIVMEIGPHREPGVDATTFAGSVRALCEGYDRWLAAPFRTDELAVRVEFTVGYDLRTIVMGDDPMALVQDAQWAAQAAVPGTPGRFSQSGRHAIRRRARLAALLDDAVAGDQSLSVVYEPLVDLRTGHTIGAESLVRWSTEDFGPVAPTEFIPIAEQTKLILPLGDWVLRTACRQAAEVGGNKYINVNLSGVEMAQPDLYPRIMRALAETGLNPKWLTLEITETVVPEAVEAAEEALLALNAAGIRLAMDDFGMAASGLSRILLLPWRTIKLDRSLVHGLKSVDSGRAALIRAVVGLSAELGITAVAEGVEDVRSLRVVAELGCQVAQGWVFGKGRSSLAEAWAGHRAVDYEPEFTMPIPDDDAAPEPA